MTTLTIRNIPDDITARLEASAKSSGASMNETVLRILAEAVQPMEREKPLNDFSRFCGGWSQEEFEAFEAVVADCEKIDEDSWK